MVSTEDNELMCRVGEGTPMGTAMRQFWLPALTSEELPDADGDPVHVELLGQSLVAFRDSNGQVGILDEMCCHRGASLTIGRAEDCGLRCIYHGWLFARDGTVLETPNVADDRFRSRFKAKAYPVHEAGGLIWAYLGDAEQVPPLPDFPWMTAANELRTVACQINGCNWVQLLEGTLDSSHLGLLHQSTLAGAQGQELKFVQVMSHMLDEAPPRIESEETPFGLHYAAIRRFGHRSEIRVAAFARPFWSYHPNGDIWIAVVPLTDTKSAFYTIWYDPARRYGAEPLKGEQLRMLGFDQQTLEAYGQTRATFGAAGTPTRGNDFRQDRGVMDRHFTGIMTIAQEDTLVCVSAGALRDRSRERLAPADMAIVHLYRHLLRTAKQVRDGATPSFTVTLGTISGVNTTESADVDWRTLVPRHYAADDLAAVE